MHELAVTENILELAVRHGEEAGATRVTELHCVIGQLSSIFDDSVQFYWDIISRGTICEGAQLHFDRVPARLRCRECQYEYIIASGLTSCPACGSMRVQVIAGDEFRLDSITIADPE